jgi:hypothetical protein
MSDQTVELADYDPVWIDRFAEQQSNTGLAGQACCRSFSSCAVTRFGTISHWRPKKAGYFGRMTPTVTIAFGF